MTVIVRCFGGSGDLKYRNKLVTCISSSGYLEKASRLLKIVEWVMFYDNMPQPMASHRERDVLEIRPINIDV